MRVIAKRPVGAASGTTAANPILTTTGEVSRDLFGADLRTQEQDLLLSFDIDAALAGYDKAM